MRKISENQATAALTFKVPQKAGWSVRRGNQSWAGSELAELVDCLVKEGSRPVTLSLSLIFDLSGGALRLQSEAPPRDD